MRRHEVIYRAAQEGWIALALLAVLFKTLQQTGGKQLLVHFGGASQSSLQKSLAMLAAVHIMLAVFCTLWVIPYLVYSLVVSRALCIRRRVAVSAFAGWLLTDVVGTVMFTIALLIGPLSGVGPLRNTGPIFSFLIGYFWFNEKNNWHQKLTGSVIVVIGAVLMQGPMNNVLPCLLAVGAAFIFSLTGLYEKMAVDKREGAGLSRSLFLYAGLVAESLIFTAGLYASGGSVVSVPKIIGYTCAHWELILYVLVGGVFSIWFGLASLVTGGIIGVSAIRRLGVITSMISGWWFFGEDISEQIVGGSVLFLGVLLVVLPPQWWRMFKK